MPAPDPAREAERKARPEALVREADCKGSQIARQR
jgi:hypothetical protein